MSPTNAELKLLKLQDAIELKPIPAITLCTNENVIDFQDIFARAKTALAIILKNQSRASAEEAKRMLPNIAQFRGDGWLPTVQCLDDTQMKIIIFTRKVSRSVDVLMGTSLRRNATRQDIQTPKTGPGEPSELQRRMGIIQEWARALERMRVGYETLFTILKQVEESDPALQNLTSTQISLLLQKIPEKHNYGLERLGVTEEQLRNVLRVLKDMKRRKQRKSIAW